MNNNYFKPGSVNVICDRCGRKYKKEDCKKEWTGLLTCFSCYDTRHPVTQPLPVVIDSRPFKDARPRPRTQMVDAPEGLSIWGSYYSGIQGLDPNLTWDAWTETWNGERNQDNFIIGT